MASAYSVRPLPDARVSTPLAWDEVPTVEAEAFTLATVPARFAAIGDPGAGIDDAVGSLDALLELSRRARGGGPGRRAVAAELREAGRRAAAGPAVEGAPPAHRVRARPRRGRRPAARGRRRACRRGRGRRPERRPPDRVGRVASPRRPADARARSRSSRSRAPRRRPRRSRVSSAGRRSHPAAAAALEPADVLVDGMRGRSSLWYRVRVNLIHVPEADRPAQAAARGRLRPVGRLRVAGPAGQLERAPRKKTTAPTRSPAGRRACRAMTRGRSWRSWIARRRLVAPATRRRSPLPSRWPPSTVDTRRVTGSRAATGRSSSRHPAAPRRTASSDRLDEAYEAAPLECTVRGPPSLPRRGSWSRPTV